MHNSCKPLGFPHADMKRNFHCLKDCVPVSFGADFMKLHLLAPQGKDALALGNLAAVTDCDAQRMIPFPLPLLA